MDDEDRDAIHQDYREAVFVGWLVDAITVAAQKRPDLLRKALASVFNVDAILADMQKATTAIKVQQDEAIAARELMASVRDDVMEIERRLTKVADWAEWLDKKYRDGYRRMKEYAQRFNSWAAKRQPPVTANGHAGTQGARK